MSSNAARKLNLLRTEGRAQNHDVGLSQERPGDINIKKINKGINILENPKENQQKAPKSLKNLRKHA